MLSPNSFQDINKVETKLALLGEQYLQATDKKAKTSIKEVIDKQELQQKKLLKLNAEKEAEEKRNQTTKETLVKKPTAQIYEINENEELVPVQTEPKESAEEGEKTNEGNQVGTGEAQVKPGFTTPKQKITRARSAIVSDKQITPNQAIETSKRKLTTSNKSREENKGRGSNATSTVV